jgi:flagellar assembly protein FliH
MRGPEPALPPEWPRADAPVAKSSKAAASTEAGARPVETVSAEELEKARKQIAQLEHTLEQRVRDAHQAGVREGEAAGRKQASAQLEPVVEKFTRTIAELAALRGQILRDSERDLLKLALEIARRVVHRELRVEPEAVDALLRYALEKAREQEVHRLRVHPGQEALVRTALERLGHPEVEVAGDPSLEVGAAIFATDRGNLDASIATQFREIEQGLADRFERKGKG